MEFQQLLQYNLQRWHRNILNAYWLVLCVTIITEILIDRWSPGKTHVPSLYEVIVPSAALAIIVTFAEIGVKVSVLKAQPRILILSGEGIALVLSAVNFQYPYVAITFLLPILVSLFYFEPRTVRVTTATSLCGVAFVCLFDWLFRQSLDIANTVTVFGILAGGAYLAGHITRRSVEMMEHLKATTQVNQDLLIQRVIVESASKLDGLTNTYNHKAFHEHLESLLQQHAEMGSEKFQIYLLIADIDDFKKVNDTFGHQVGDVILKRVADTIKKGCLPNDFLARYGGEEFALVMVERSAKEAMTFAKKICETIACLSHPEVEGLPVTISGGLAKYRFGDSKDDLFRAADSALYRAKQQGKNQIVFSNEQAAQKPLEVDDTSFPNSNCNISEHIPEDTEVGLK